jgi:tetratricopeptide (TPR) repeat protein
LLCVPPEWARAEPFQSPSSVPSTFPVQFRKAGPYESLYKHIEPGHDEFASEKRADEISAHLDRLLEAKSLPLAAGFSGTSPNPVSYRVIGSERRVTSLPEFAASFASSEERGQPAILESSFSKSGPQFQSGLEDWLKLLGEVQSVRFFVTQIELKEEKRASARVRYEISSRLDSNLSYHVGSWRQDWAADRLLSFQPVEEIVVLARQPLFVDMTFNAFGGCSSFQRQLLNGVPYWRARLDSASGIDVYGNNGVAVGDIDNDGWDEIYVCQPGGLPNRLFKNRGDGTLTDITEQAGVDVLDDTSCALFVDFRNNGLQDLVVLRSGGPSLFLNQGDGRFQHKSDAFRFARPPQGTFTGMAAADYDNDGRADLYLCCYIYFQSEDQYRYPVPYHDAQNGPPNFLLRNQLNRDGTGLFEDVTEAVGLNQNNNRYSFAPAWCDVDDDGWPDLYVANDFGRSNLYRNERGKFQDVAATANVENIGPGMSAAWFDYDGDGRQDLYVANMWTPAGQRLIRQKEFLPMLPQERKTVYHGHTRGNALYRNRGDGSFEDQSAQQGVEMGRWAWSSDGLDFDNDGTPEIYVTCGMLTNSGQKDLMSFFWRQVVARTPPLLEPAPAYENGWNALNQLIREDYSWNGHEPNVFYVRREGRFYDLSGVSGLDLAEDSRAFAATDLDGDGNLDLVLKSRLGPQVRAFRNHCGVERHSLAIRLVGTKSNRDAIGARVEVEIAECGTGNADCGSRRQVVQFVKAGSGYLSQHTKPLYFGLGEATRAARVSVQWPTGGRQEFVDLEAGYRYEITEGRSEFKKTTFLSRTGDIARHPQSPIANPQSESRNPKLKLQANNTPQLRETWLLEPVPLPEKRTGPGFVCLVGGRQISAPAGLPFHIVDLSKEPSEVAAGYALFRRYLFDWRASLSLPLLLLIDERGNAHKIYPAIPDAATLRADLSLLRVSSQSEVERQKLALPFAGRYYTQPLRRYFQLGAAFFWAGYPEQALQYLSEATRSTPDNFKAHLAIGQIHLEAKRLTEARRSLEIARDLNPQSPDVWNNLGGVEAAAENYGAALRDYEKALSLKADLPYVLNNAGQAYSKIADHANAERMFRRALELDPQDADASNQLGLALAQLNRWREARDYFQKAITLKRDHAGAINNLGVLYTQMNQVNDAVAAFQYGIEVVPESDSLYLNLARVYVRLQERNKARDVIQRLLARKPNHPAALKALQELGER